MKSRRTTTLLSLVAAITTFLIVALLIVNIVYETRIEADQAPLLIALYSSLVIISLFTYGILQISFWKGRFTTTSELVNSVNSINASQEEIFKVGTIMYDNDEIITFVTPWLLKEGFDGLLGKSIKSLGIQIGTTDRSVISKGSHKWEVTLAPKYKIVMIQDITTVDTLRKIIDSQLKAVISVHTAFSKKLNLNGSAKADATLKLNQALKEWVDKNGGLLNASLSTEGTVSGIFDWRRGEKEILSQALLETLEKVNGKSTKDITLSIGVAYGNNDYIDILDNALKSLELSKNRGGGQIVLTKHDGTTEYIGLSTAQAVSGSVLNIKRFYSEFITDVSKARDVYITAHKMADLDAIGSALGILELIEDNNDDVYIILEEFDQTAQRFVDSLPKRLRDKIITEKEAIKNISSMAHFVITDTSNPKSTQAENVLEDIAKQRITIIDHHRVNKASFEYEESKTLIETSTSSASELVVQMLKLYLGDDAQTDLDPYVATGLLSGIRLDSKQLSKNVTNSTFEAVAWLMNNEANTTETEALFRPSQDLIKFESEAFANISRPTKGIIFTYIDEKKIIPDEDISILADKLLSYDGIVATFVLGKTPSGRFKLSARSNGKLNVQEITENLGGGGHFNVAAASWASTSKFSNIKTRVNKELGKIKQEN